MQIPPAYGTYQSGDPSLNHQSNFVPISQVQLTSAPINNYGLLPHQTPLTSDLDPSHQQDPPPSYYTTYPFKQEGEFNSQALTYPNNTWSQDPSSLLFNSDLLCYSAPPAIPPAAIPNASKICNYGVVSTGPFDGAASGDPWSDVPLHDYQSHFDIILPNQRGGKRGPFKSPTLREQTAQTRKVGCCIRCRMQRIRVSFAPWKRDNEAAPSGPRYDFKELGN